MKDLRHITIIIAMVMMGMASCEKEIPFEDIETEAYLVVNGVQKVGEPAWLRVEKSSIYLSIENDYRVKDVHADLYVNGVFKETLQVRDSLVYETWEDWETGELHEELTTAFTCCEGTYVLCEGDALRFEVSAPEFEEKAVAEVLMPTAPEVLSFDTIRIERAEDYGYSTLYFALKIKDPAGADYYNLYPQGAMDGFISSDPVFSYYMDLTQIGDMFGGSDYYGRGSINPFSDTYFDGKEYSVSMRVSYYGNEYYEPFTLLVSRVDENLYQFYKSYSAYVESDPESLLGMFTEPVQVYSNIQNGIGVVSAQSRPVTVSIDLGERKTEN